MVSKKKSEVPTEMARHKKRDLTQKRHLKGNKNPETRFMVNFVLVSRLSNRCDFSRFFKKYLFQTLNGELGYDINTHIKSFCTLDSRWHKRKFSNEAKY